MVWRGTQYAKASRSFLPPWESEKTLLSRKLKSRCSHVISEVVAIWTEEPMPCNRLTVSVVACGRITSRSPFCSDCDIWLSAT